MTRTQFGEFDGLKERILVDTSENRTSYLVAGKNGSHMRLSPSAYNLLRIFISGMSYEEAAGRLEAQGRKVTPEDLEIACRQVADSVLQIESTTDKMAGALGFWFRWRLLPKELVTRLIAPLRFAFRAEVVLPVLLLALLAGAVTAMVSSPSAALSSHAFWWGYGLLIASLAAHELGHATACGRYGAAPYDIGFTIYLIYPAFYSDVSSAWKLNRWQRVVVDLGGAYFQIIVGIAYVVLFLISGWDAFAVAAWMILYSLAFSLNPIFRFDGYWVLADSLGVTNLGSLPFQLIGRTFRRLRGQTVEPLPWPRLVIAILFVYTPLTLFVWGFFLWRLLPLLGERLVSYPGIVFGLVSALVRGASVSGQETRALLSSTFLLIIAGLMIWRLLGPLGVALAKALWRLATGSKKDAGASVEVTAGTSAVAQQTVE